MSVAHAHRRVDPGQADAGVATGHVSVLLEEAVAALSLRDDGIYVDATFGRGGHSRAILAKLGPNGTLFALDRDPAAVAAGNAMNDARFRMIHAPFSEVDVALREADVTAVDGVLFDLGVSSPQLDEAERGFSFRFDAPLDMRMDTSRGMTAAAWLNQAPEEEIARVVRDYGEERFARQVARAITQARTVAPLTRTRQLAQVVAGAVRTRERGQDPATRTFQAVRIFVNRELEEIEQALPRAAALLKTGGRLVVISFHSLEDRMVKRYMRRESEGEQVPLEIPLPASALRGGCLRLIGNKVKPSESESRANPRARSATMRVAERTEVPWSS